MEKNKEVLQQPLPDEVHDILAQQQQACRLYKLRAYPQALQKFVDAEMAMSSLPEGTAGQRWWRRNHFFIYRAHTMCNEADHIWIPLPMEVWELEDELSAKPSPWRYRFTVRVVTRFGWPGLWVLDALHIATDA